MRKAPRLSALILVLALTLAGSTTGAQEALRFRAVATGFEIWRGPNMLVTVALDGGAIHDFLRLGNTLYVARGESGVTAFDISTPERPLTLHTIRTDRQAVKLTSAGSTLVVIVADYGAVAYNVSDPSRPVATRLERALSQLAPSAAPPATLPGSMPAPGPAPQLPPPAPGRTRKPAVVTGISGGWLYIKSPVPLQRGDRFIIRSQRLVQRPDPKTGQPREVPSDKPLGTLVIDQVDGEVGAGRLHRGTQAELGDLADPTERAAPRNPIFPAQWRGMTRLTAHLRPLLPVKELGFGMLTSFSAQHYFRFPLKLGLEINPLGFVAIGPGTGFTSEVQAWLAFSHDYFEIGLAPGVELQRLDKTARFLFAYAIRLGSLDGLNLEFQNSYVVVSEGGKDQFRFQSAIGEINIPVHARFMLTLEGGGGRTFGYGAAGVKYYLRGGGGPGTIILRTSVGGALVRDESPATPSTPSRSVEGAGPALSFGVDARL